MDGTVREKIDANKNQSHRSRRRRELVCKYAGGLLLTRLNLLVPYDAEIT